MTRIFGRGVAGRLRRAQTFLRALGIDIAFAREDRGGNRIIRMHTRLEGTDSTVSSVRTAQINGTRLEQDPSYRVGRCGLR